MVTEEAVLKGLARLRGLSIRLGDLGNTAITSPTTTTVGQNLVGKALPRNPKEDTLEFEPRIVPMQKRAFASPAGLSPIAKLFSGVRSVAGMAKKPAQYGAALTGGGYLGNQIYKTKLQEQLQNQYDDKMFPGASRSPELMHNQSLVPR